MKGSHFLHSSHLSQDWGEASKGQAVQPDGPLQDQEDRQELQGAGEMSTQVDRIIDRYDR